MSSTRAAYTLIEMMVALAVLAIGSQLLARTFILYQDAARRARAVVAVAEVLNLELEAARACSTRACLAGLVSTGTTALMRNEASSWARPVVRRQTRPGPDGTVRVRVTAEIPGLVSPRTLTALVEVP